MKLHYLFPSGIRNTFWLPGKVNILASKVCVSARLYLKSLAFKSLYKRPTFHIWKYVIWFFCFAKRYRIKSSFICRWFNHDPKQDYKIALISCLLTVLRGWWKSVSRKMVFQKRARKNAELRFLIDGQIIESRISSSGNFSAREHLKEKALHARFSLTRYTNLSKLKTILLLVKYLIRWSPLFWHLIVKYIWGAYAKPDF